MDHTNPMHFANDLTRADFDKVDIRVGTVVSAHPFPLAKNPAFKLEIDFGEGRILKSSAQITDQYSCEELAGMQILAVVNFPPKQIANFMSECLVLGIHTKDGVVLIAPQRRTRNGSKLS